MSETTVIATVISRAASHPQMSRVQLRRGGPNPNHAQHTPGAIVPRRGATALRGGLAHPALMPAEPRASARPAVAGRQKSLAHRLIPGRPQCEVNDLNKILDQSARVGTIESDGTVSQTFS